MITNALFILCDIVFGSIKMIILFYEYENNHLFGGFLFLLFYLRNGYLERQRSKQVDQFVQKLMDELTRLRSSIKEYKKNQQTRS